MWGSRKEVIVVEQADAFMGAGCNANRGCLIRALLRLGARLLPASRVAGIRSDGVELSINTSNTVPDPEAVWWPILPSNIHNPFACMPEILEEQWNLEADMVLLAVGSRPNADLFRDCIEQHAATEVRSTGDSFRVGRIFDATKAAHAFASAL